MSKGEATETEKMRLILVRALFLRGCVHADESNKISRMTAIHLFDNSVEMALKVIASKRGISPDGKYFFFEELLGKIQGLPLEQQMKDLHIQRNIIQHVGDIPDLETVTKYEGLAREFLAAITESEFGLSFGKLSVASMIEDPKLRGLLENAQNSFETGTVEGYIESITLCRGALDNAISRIGIISGNRGQHTTFFPYEFLGKFKPSFRRFRDIVARANRIPQDRLRHEAEFSVQFVTDLILKWQEEREIREDRKNPQER